MNTDLSEFDVFVDQLPEDVAKSLRFIPVRGDKAADVPREEDLKRDEYWLSLGEARARLGSGKNVGPVLRDQLAVLVVMDPEKVRTYLEKLPPTLKVSTRSGETHLYYLRGDGIESRDIPGTMELRTGNRYIVAPGSYASDGGGENWGTYTVEEARKVAEITPDDLPEELKPRKRPEKKENVNEHGWRVESIREEDGVLDALLTRKRPPNLGFMSKEDADRKAIEKLLFWEFSPSVIAKIMKEYRGCGEEITSLYTEVFSEFQAAGENVISDVENVDTFCPGSSGGLVLTRDVKAELEKEAFYESKLEWTDEEGRETKFVTFLEDVVLPSSRRIEAGETRELLADLAEKLTDSGGARKIASQWAWECPSCKELYTPSEYKEPPACPNPNCDRKKMDPLHPQTEEDAEKVLRSNYNFLAVRESNKPNKEPILYVYSKGRYVKRGVIGLVRKKLKQMRPNSRPSFRSRVVSDIVDDVQILQKRFGAPRNKVVVENGVLDLETLDLEDHSPDVYATYKMNAPYDPNAECPMFEQLVRDLIPREKDRVRVQELLGTALVDEKLHKKAAVMVGPTDSGKSTFALIIRDIFGKDSTESETLKALADTRWAGIALLDRSLNIATEMSSGRISNLSGVKNMISGEPIKVEDKGTSKIKIEPHTEHLYCANQTPRVDRQAQAFWRRFFVMETRDSIPKDEQDPKIREEILKRERSGILNWLIEGYKRFAENGGKFTHPQEWTETRKKWLGWGDSIQRFIQDCVEEGPGEKYTTREIYNAYLDYCDSRPRLEADSHQNLTQRIKRTVKYANYSRRFRFDGVRKPGFEGIHLNMGRLYHPSTNSLPKKEKVKNKSLARGSEDPVNLSRGEKVSGKESLETTPKRPKREETLGKESSGTSPKRPTGGGKGEGSNNRVRVQESFVYKEEAFSPGDTAKLPKEVAKEAAKKGYAETISETEDLYSSTSPSQKDKARTVYDIVHNLQDEYDEGVPLDVIKKEAKSSGVSSGFVDEFVEKEKIRGHLIETEKNGEKAVRLNE